MACSAPILCTVQFTVCPRTSLSRQLFDLPSAAALGRASARSSSPLRSPSSWGWRSWSRTASPTSFGAARRSRRSIASRRSSAATWTRRWRRRALTWGARGPGDRRPARAADALGRDPPDQHLVAGRSHRLFERPRAPRPALLDRADDRERLLRRERRRYADGDGAGDAATDGPTRRSRASRRCPVASSSCSSRSGVPSTATRSASTTLYQDARLIEQRIDDTRSGVFIVAIVASTLLVALIWLAFGGASRVLAGQNRRLQEQATTERLLLVDMQRKEERFRSLVQNASDGVVVLGEDGLIRYESPAVERILGRRAGERIGQPVGDGHPSRRSRCRGTRVGRRRGRERLRGQGGVPGPPRRRLVANARGDRQEPPRRCGGRRRGRQLPRHHRAQDPRGAAPSPGVPRRADRPREPLPVPRPTRSRAGSGGPRGPTDRGPVPRPRRLQGRQRPAGPRRGRQAARGRRTAAARS